MDIASITDADEFDRSVTSEITISVAGLRIGNSGGGLNTFYQTDFDLTASLEIIGVGYVGDNFVGNSHGSHVQNSGTNNVEELTLAEYFSTRDPSSGTYVLNAGTMNGTYVSVGQSGHGTFEQNGGVANAQSLGIGYSPQSQGTYRLRDGLLHVDGTEYLGFAGAGTFIHSGGTHTISGDFSFGMDSSTGASGTYILNGASATLSSNIELMGRHNPGTFLQTAGYHVAEASTVGYIDSGHYDMSGGSFDVKGNLTLGFYGRGTFNLTGVSASLNVEGTTYIGYFGRGTFYQGEGKHVIRVLDIGGTPLDAQSSEYRLIGGSLSVGKEVHVGVSGPGRFTQSGGSFSTPLLTIGSGGTVTYSGGSFSVPAVTLSGRMTVVQGSGSALTLNALKITPFSDGALDLTDNQLVINFTGASPLSTIQQYLADGRLFSSAAIPGVTGLGYAEGPSSVRVAYTYMGDTDLDGVADLFDFANFLTGFGPAEASPLWLNGDFDYNDEVDLGDFELYLRGYYALGGSTEGIIGAVQSAAIGESNRLAMLNLAATVPEPLAITSLTAIPLLRRRNRRASGCSIR